MGSASESPIVFDNSYARLPDRFFSRTSPNPVKEPGLIRVNHVLARALNIDVSWLESADGLEVLSGNLVPAKATPIATAYAGHQFGHFNPQLGDGRAILLGEVLGQDGRRYDLQLKGSGQTPFSRNGDGRSPLGPVLREYIVSEAMHQLGVPTSRALSAVSTGQSVVRDRSLPGGILLRVAQSHIRIGTFEFFAAQRDKEALRLLTDHAVSRHYEDAADSDGAGWTLLKGAVQRQAELIARWQCLGFIHGVMNTDNMLISGETIDYGPCAFMDAYDPKTVFSSIDRRGRYAFGNQPFIAKWNLACLARAILPVLTEGQTGEKEAETIERTQAVINEFEPLYFDAYWKGLRKKAGLTEVQDEDESLLTDFLELLEQERSDFTLSFRRLAEVADKDFPESESIKDLFDFDEAFSPWIDRWRKRTESEKSAPGDRSAAMLRASPVFIPRNHLVEEVIDRAVDENDLAPFQELAGVTAHPHDFHSRWARYAKPPRPEQVVAATFCGT